MPERTEAIRSFLDRSGWGRARMAPLAGDASFRRYARLTDQDRRAVLMDAPPERESVAPFVRMARHLLGLGLSAPAIMAADEAAGLLLLEDFGDDTFSRLLAAGADEAALYRSAVEVLAFLHALPSTRAAPADAPIYDERRLLDEALLLTDWWLPAVLGRPSPAAERDAYVAAWREALPVAAAGAPTLVLRDFHVDNLMRLDGRAGLSRCGLLDFQDAVVGPASYDLMSLLEDARRDVAESLRADMLEHYFERAPAVDREAFLASFAILAAQRHAKVIGIFTRLDRRDGKPIYLEHIPRVWRMLERALAHPALAPVARWFERAVPKPLRGAPSAAASPPRSARPASVA